MKIGRTPAAAPTRHARATARCRQRLERCRPLRRLQRLRCRIEPLQHAGARALRPRAGRPSLIKPGHRRGRLRPARAPRRSRAPAPDRTFRLAVKGDVDLRELAIERLGEVGGAGLQAVAHARALRLARLHRANGTGTSRASRAGRRGRRRRSAATPGRPVVKIDPHESHCTRNAASGSARFTSLTKRLPGDNNFRARPLVILLNEVMTCND